MAAVAKQSGLSLPTIRAVEGNTATVRSLIQSISALDGTIMVAGQRAAQIGLLLSKERHKKKISQRSMAKVLGC
ncbi:hypothetical protein [Halocynthiibacter namhaensis]|uniref:hypothetical protein n=1 Tax=Halocynthiibacter namhaensis TaxID=1290553 RepID=UPI0012E09B9A|nr:hypothetical protein [Halocynthiibacter namhaensis]